MNEWSKSNLNADNEDAISISNSKPPRNRVPSFGDQGVSLPPSLCILVSTFEELVAADAFIKSLNLQTQSVPEDAAQGNLGDQSAHLFRKQSFHVRLATQTPEVLREVLDKLRADTNVILKPVADHARLPAY